MNEIPDGEPIDMSQISLGEPYTSEDMYRDYLVPGSRVAVERDGVIYTDTVQSVHYDSGEPEIWRTPSWWERFIPRRFRKPLVIRPAKAASVTVNCGAVGEDVRQRHERTMASLQQAGEVIDGLIKSEPHEF